MNKWKFVFANRYKDRLKAELEPGGEVIYLINLSMTEYLK